MYQPSQVLPLQLKSAAGSRSIAIITLISFIFLTIAGPFNAFADNALLLPQPGSMVNLSPVFTPLMIKGLKIHKDNPFEFDFIVNQGQENLPENQFKEESLRLVKYFLASLTIPEDDLWVNLSPYEKNRITTSELGVTEMGKDLLSQDYILKQLTSSLIYPEGETGKKFWSKVYALAEQRFHTTNVSINTFNKVWIVPQMAEVYENSTSQTAYVIESKLKVMLEEDYLALQKHSALSSPQENVSNDLPPTNSIGNQIVREIVIPELTREVNYGKNFANLRQITNSLILAAWFKRALKASILAKLYVDQKKISGVDLQDRTVKERIYQQYLRAYKKGVYNYIKEEADPVSQKIVPRKYFSGGYKFIPGSIKIENALDPAQVIGEANDRAVIVQLDNAIAAISSLVPVVPQRTVILFDDQKQLLDALFAIFGNRRGKDFLLNPQRRNNPQFNAADVQREVNKRYKPDGPSRLSALQLNAFNSLVKRPGAFNARITKEQYAAYIQEWKDKAMAADSLIELAKVQLEKFGEAIDTADKQHRFARRYQEEVQGWVDQNLKDILKDVVPQLDHPKDFQRYERNLILPPVKTPIGQIALFIHVANPLKGVPPHFHGDNEIGGFAWIVPLNTTFIEEKWLGLPSHRGQKLITLNQADVITRKPGIVYNLADDDGPHVMLNSSPTEFGAFLELYILPPNGIKGFDIPVPQFTPENRVNSIIPQVDANRLLRYDNFGVAAQQGEWQEVSSNDEDAVNYILHNPQAVVFQVVHGVNVVIPQDRLSRGFLKNAALILRDPKQPRLFFVFDAAMTSQVRYKVASVEEVKDPNNINRIASGIIREGEYSFKQQDIDDRFNDKPLKLVVIGGGPAGLATAFQGVDSKLDGVALFEAGLIAQAFSNVAQPFEDMRTPPRRFSLVQLGPNSKDSQYLNLQNPDNISSFRALALEGEKVEAEAFGANTKIARPKGYDTDLSNAAIPTARAVAYQHFITIANAIVSKGGLIEENDPVVSVKKLNSGLFEVTTRKGIKVTAENVVLATGAGSEKVQDDLQKLATTRSINYAVYGSQQDIVKNNFKELSEFNNRIPIFKSQFLYDPRIIDYLKKIPANSTIAIVGGGQSAGNSVVFVHRIRPDIVIHLFAKDPLTRGPSQMPSGLRTQRQMTDLVTTPLLQQEAWKKAGPGAFGVPITLAVYDYLQEAKAKGTFVEHIGNYFNERNYSIRTKHDEEGRTLAVITNMQNFNERIIINGGFISAVGYTLDRPARDPFYQNLVKEGLVSLNPNGEVAISPDGLTSDLNKHIFVSGIGLGTEGSPTDGTTHGPTIRSREIIEEILGIYKKVEERDLIAKVVSDFKVFSGITGGDEKAAAFLTLAANQPGEDILSIEGIYKTALRSNSNEQAARYAADISGQSGKAIKAGYHYVTPGLSDDEIISRVFATEQPGFLGEVGRSRISTLFNAVRVRTITNEATEQLLYPITQIGLGLDHSFHLYDSLIDSGIKDPLLAAILVRAATSYLPPHINDRGPQAGEANKAMTNQELIDGFDHINDPILSPDVKDLLLNLSNGSNTFNDPDAVPEDLVFSYSSNNNGGYFGKHRDWNAQGYKLIWTNPKGEHQWAILEAQELKILILRLFQADPWEASRFIAGLLGIKRAEQARAARERLKKDPEADYVDLLSSVLSAIRKDVRIPDELGAGIQELLGIFNVRAMNVPLKLFFESDGKQLAYKGDRDENFVNLASLLTKDRTLFNELYFTIESEEDQAMIGIRQEVPSRSSPGGIDLNTANLDLQIKHDGQGFPLPIEFQNLSDLHINGLKPVIIKDVPIINLYEYLGANAPLAAGTQLASF